jgi:hypothetical protein
MIEIARLSKPDRPVGPVEPGTAIKPPKSVKNRKKPATRPVQPGCILKKKSLQPQNDVVSLDFFFFKKKELERLI